MLHCLALGSIVYYGLEVTHHYLDSELIIEELQARVRELERGVQEGRLIGSGPGVARAGADGVGSGDGGKWWKVW